MIFYSVLTKLKPKERTLLLLDHEIVFAPMSHDDHMNDHDHVYSLDADHECHHSVLQNLLFRAHDSDLSPSPCLYLFLILYLCPYLVAYLYRYLLDPCLIPIGGLCPEMTGVGHLIASWAHPHLGKHPSNLSVSISSHPHPSLLDREGA